MMYGAFHAGIRLPDLKTHDGKRDALLGTKLFALIASTAFAPSLFPIYIYNDVNRIHIHVNKLSIQDYGYKSEFSDITDILFN